MNGWNDLNGHRYCLARGIDLFLEAQFQLEKTASKLLNSTYFASFLPKSMPCPGPTRGRIGVSQSEAFGHCGKMVAKHGPIPIYFAVVDSRPTIEYEAELVDVHLDPPPLTQRHRLRSTREKPRSLKACGKRGRRLFTFYVVVESSVKSEAFLRTDFAIQTSA